MIGIMATRRAIRASLAATETILPNLKRSSCRHSSGLVPDESLVDSSASPEDFTSECAVVYADFLTREEGDVLVQDISNRMKRYVDFCRPLPSGQHRFLMESR
jgi:hypothetical protein